MLAVFSVIETVLFYLALLGATYLFVFALGSLRKNRSVLPAAGKLNRVAVFIPAYREDEVICSSAQAMLEQDYPSDLFDVIVISDRMKPETNRRLGEMPLRLMTVDYENSSKAKALNFAVGKLKNESYGIAVVMDADNIVGPEFLRRINDAYEAGIKAVQAHRKAKNLDSDTAILDATSEEINNSIFRLGHVNLGFSSALIGSGMAFDYAWFADNIPSATTAGEDKELEALLLRQGIYIGYLDDVYVLDQKTNKEGAFYRQRRRWLAAQLGMFARTAKEFPRALSERNYDYCDKMLQWIMPPRVILLGLIGAMAVATTLVDWMQSVKWWGLLIFMLFALCIAIPDYLVGRRFYRAIRKVPWLGVLMFLNFFKLRGVNRKFIHTDHSAQSVDAQ